MTTTGRKAAIVTGAASGLGRAMALGLVGSGMDVVAVDRNATALAALAPDAARLPGAVLPLAADLTEPDAFDRIAELPGKATGASTSWSTMPASAKPRCARISDATRYGSGKRPRISGSASSP